MNGGPSQMDTFDLKPGHANGGPFKEIADHRSRHPHQRTPAASSPRHMDGMAIDPLDDHPRRRPRPGDVLPAHRLSAAGPDPVSDARLAGVQGTGQRRARRCRTSSASPRIACFSPAAYGPGFLGPQYAPLIVGDVTQLRFGRRPGSRLRPGRSARAGPATAGERRAAHQADARIDLLRGHGDATSLPAIPAVAGRSHQHRLRPGRPPDAHRGPAAFNLDEERPAAARRLRPQPVRPGLPAGPPAGRARRAVRRGHAGSVPTAAVGWDTHDRQLRRRPPA